MDSLRTKLRYLTDAHSTVQTDIAVTKRATEKATVDVTKAQDEKQKQVRMYVHTCVCALNIQDMISAYIILYIRTYVRTYVVT